MLGGDIVYHNWQGSPGGTWVGWFPLGSGSIATTPTAAINNDGRLELFAQRTDGAGLHLWQTSPGGAWTDWSSLGGVIAGSPSTELDNNGSINAFAISPNGSAFYASQANGFGWNYLGGVINAAPSVAMNFDQRQEIFGIGTDGNVYHNWQTSAAGPWSGWYGMGTPSNAAGTDPSANAYIVSDADNEANYASKKSQQCPSNFPNIWRGPINGATYAWPCGALVNVGVSGYKSLKPFQEAIDEWNFQIATYYARYAQSGVTPLPAGLSISAGGPHQINVVPVCDTCIKPEKGVGYARGQNLFIDFTSSQRLLTVRIELIRGVTDRTALKDLFAHEIGHTFGLLDCDSKNTSYDCSKSVMISFLKVPSPDLIKNASSGYTANGTLVSLLPGPTNCDLSVIDQGLPDFRQCLILRDTPPRIPTCTNGAAIGFADTGGLSSTYACGAALCDGCNPSCNNFAPQKCGGGGGGGGSCSSTSSCDDFSPGVFATNYCSYPSGGCPDGYISSYNCCYNGTPIAIDAFNEGFHMTSLSKGVNFRILPGQSLYQMSWTDPQWRNGWLALDRNGNGTIDDFTELFGNITAQTANGVKNGFRALAVFDDPMNGGNGNGVLDPADSVYQHLRIWIDSNHDGVSQASELHTLRELGIFKIDLNYHLSHYVDSHGNEFRYKSRIWDAGDQSHELCYDITVEVEKAQKADQSK